MQNVNLMYMRRQWFLNRCTKLMTKFIEALLKAEMNGANAPPEVDRAIDTIVNYLGRAR